MRTIKDVRDNLRPRRAMNVLRLASNVADAETITLGTEVYEIDTAAAPGAITAGNIRVDCNAGVTPAIAAPSIVAAINANTKLPPFITYAAAEMARELIKQDRTDDPDGEGLKTIRIEGTFRLEFNPRDRQPVVTRIVQSMLGKYGIYLGARQGMAKLVRA